MSHVKTNALNRRTTNRKKIAYICPVYNEEAGIKEFYSQLCNATDKLKINYEFTILFINDGSTDNSYEVLKDIQRADERVSVVNFSRNFGHQMAVSAGVDYADADAAIIIDTDLQDPPEVSIQLIEKWEEGFDVVYAQRKTRQDKIFKRLTAHIYYRLLHSLTETDIPRDTGDFRLLDRKVIIELRKFREKNRYIRGIVSSIGFRQISVKFDRAARYTGKSNYPLNKMLKLAMDGITSFSVTPLRIITRIGFLILALSFLGILYALYMKLFMPQRSVSGWTLMMISILLIGGVQTVSLGIIATYVGRIYTESQNRPLYIVSEFISNDNGSNNNTRQET